MHFPTTNPSLRRRGATALTLAAAALALAAAPAAADSVAYIKDGNVWLSTPDGARQYQVTTDGGYSTVSQADSGRMVVLRGDKLRHLERDGRVIAEIATPVSTSTDPSMAFKGPFDPEISPDGKRVAYTYYWQYTGYDPYCNPSNNCYVKRLYHGTGFTDPNRLTAWDEPGFLRRSGWIDAAWVDNDTVLLSDPYIQPNEDTVLWSPGAPDSLRRWFQDPLHPGDVAEATISRDKSAMATITSGDKSMSILRSAGRFYPDYPHRCFEANVEEGAGDDAFINSPTFNADGTRLYWAAREGVYAASLPKFSYDACGTPTDGGGVLIAGAKSPSWGPADVPAARMQDQPKPPDRGPGVVDPVDGPGGKGPGPAIVRLNATRTSLGAALRRGLQLRLAGAAPGRHAVTVTLGTVRVGAGRVRVAADGTGTARVRFTTGGKRRLAGKRSATLTVRAAGATTRVRLKR